MGGQDILAATSISPVVVSSAQMGTSEAALYTVPAATSVKIATAAICNVSSLIAAPVLTAGTTSTTGGTLAAATYYYKVTAKSASGETLGSNEINMTTTGTTSSNPFSWTAVPGAVSYPIYRGTAAGAENVLVATVTATSYTDIGAAGTSAALPTVSTYSVPATVFLSIVNAAGTLGDGTHRIIHNFTLNGNDTFFFPAGSLPGAMLGPGDRIAGYCSIANAVDFVLTGTVHA